MDIGHTNGYEYARCRDAAESLGWNQRQFNDYMNNPNFYQWEDHASNISHAYENKNKDLSKLIKEMKQFEDDGFIW
ncbi:type IV secretion protein Rhs (plasmid) [Clostridium butyricum]|uniref:GH-E family nuclease n=1 Tax=Clostridium butyricum TaxID=1492 RepID=UPI0013D2770B|nr:HNH/ENDO VII family nuclease [Clostridium butyricum]NFB73528.1 type IV secretion protein Rhs [Clostridium butyricum]NFB92908.1 type IV secretion protein Rhs [Clostridium butyricum]UTY55672.1 type IV secretion protein Rhs [Clostridium butyricum]